MLTYALLIFAIAAVGGLVLAASVLRGRLAPWALSIVHALLGATGLDSSAWNDCTEEGRIHSCWRSRCGFSHVAKRRIGCMSHPLHPALVHFPIACWSLATVTDLASLYWG